MANCESFSYPSSDGIHTIHAKRWSPQGTPRGIVQIVHGVAEYVGRYDHVAQFLTQQGFLVCGEDHLGHGLSVDDGVYGTFLLKDGWNLVVQDVRRLRELMGAHYLGVPYVMLGHSMGSFLARTYLIRWPGTVDGAVLSGTGQEPAFTLALGKALAQLECRRLGPQGISPLVDSLSLGAYNRRFRPNRTASDWVSRDEAVVDAYLKDPLCTFKPAATMFRDMMGGLQFIAKKKNLAKMDIKTPVYFFSGNRDPVGAMGKGVEKVANLFRAVGCENVTVKLYPDGRHEMFNELNRQEVLEDLLGWLDGQIRT